MPEETRLFLRSFLFAFVVAVVYWFVSYDFAGTILLGAFSLASLFAFAIIRSEEPAKDTRRTERSEQGEGIVGHVMDWVGTTEQPGMERPFDDERGRIPVASVAPVAVGVGVALIAFGLIFGPWGVVAGAIPLLLGLREWIGEASAELAAIDVDDELAAAQADVVPPREEATAPQRSHSASTPSPHAPGAS